MAKEYKHKKKRYIQVMLRFWLQKYSFVPFVFLGKCDFDHNSLCDWRNEKIMDQFDWKIRKGPTPSVNTGPTNDNSGENKFKSFNTASMQVSSDMFSRTFSNRSSPTLSSSYIKQLLDEVFVISGIIKVEVSVISQTEGRG